MNEYYNMREYYNSCVMSSVTLLNKTRMFEANEEKHDITGGQMGKQNQFLRSTHPRSRHACIYPFKPFYIYMGVHTPRGTNTTLWETLSLINKLSEPVQDIDRKFLIWQKVSKWQKTTSFC